MPIKALVIPGGGLNFFVYYGIIKTLQEHNKWQYENLHSIYATSCGSIIACLILSKLKWADIDTYLLDRPWHKTWKLDINMLINSFSSNGLIDIQFLESFFEPILNTCGWNKHITLKELYDITGIKLYLFATRFDDFKPIVLNHNTYPDLPLIYAIYISCTIIPLFKPLEWKNKYFIDGFYSGTDNPINYALKSIDEKELLTFNFIIKDETNINHDIKNITLLELTFITLTKIIDKQFKKYYKKSKIKTTNQVHLYFIPFNSQPWKDFIYDKNIRKNLINKGVEYGNIFLNYDH